MSSTQIVLLGLIAVTKLSDGLTTKIFRYISFPSLLLLLPSRSLYPQTTSVDIPLEYDK
jgi:hypothetical protein